MVLFSADLISANLLLSYLSAFSLNLMHLNARNQGVLTEEFCKYVSPNFSFEPSISSVMMSVHIKTGTFELYSLSGTNNKQCRFISPGAAS